MHIFVAKYYITIYFASQSLIILAQTKSQFMMNQQKALKRNTTSV